MRQDRPDLGALLGVQLRSVPALNDAVTVERKDAGTVVLRVPLQERGWSRALRRLLPISHERKMELDALGAEVLLLCDGRHTVEQLVDLHMERWQLSFFEARAMILYLLKRLMKHEFVVLLAPEPGPEPPAD